MDLLHERLQGPASGETGPSESPRILIVDDDANVRAAVARIARRAFRTDDPPSIETADSPEAALALLAPFHGPGARLVVISDYNMGTPRTGLDLLEEIGRLYPRSRRILMSGYDLPEIATARQSRDLDGFVGKPFDVRELSDLMIRLVREGAPA